MQHTILSYSLLTWGYKRNAKDYQHSMPRAKTKAMTQTNHPKAQSLYRNSKETQDYKRFLMIISILTSYFTITTIFQKKILEVMNSLSKLILRNIAFKLL